MHSLSSLRIICVALSLWCVAIPANADDTVANAGTTASSVSATAASPTPAPTATPLPQAPVATPNPQTPTPPAFSGALGDFGNGDRSNLAKHGFTVNGHLVTESAANVSGGLPLGGTAHALGTAISSEFGFGFDLDLAKLTARNGPGIVHFLLTTRFGSNLSAQALGNLASVEEIYGDGQTTRITYFDYEQPLAKGKLDLRLGKYNQQNDFIAGSTYWGANLYCFYENNNICGTPAGIPINNGVLASGSGGYVYYPSSQWGARLKVNLSKDLYAQAAAVQVNPIVNNQNGGLYFGFNGGVGTELPLELGGTLRDRAGNLNGDIRVGGYYDTSNVQDYASRARGALTLTPLETNATGLASNTAAVNSIATNYVRGRSGAYVQFDHLLGGSSAPGSRGTALFTAFEYSDPQTSLISTDFEIGTVFRGPLASRKNDALALGFASENYNVRLQRLEDALQTRGFTVPNTVQDQVVEMNYSIQVAPWWVIRPGAQYVINPSGIKPNPGVGVVNPARNAFVFGLGSYITL